MRVKCIWHSFQSEPYFLKWIIWLGAVIRVTVWSAFNFAALLLSFLRDMSVLSPPCSSEMYLRHTIIQRGPYGGHEDNDHRSSRYHPHLLVCDCTWSCSDAAMVFWQHGASDKQRVRRQVFPIRPGESQRRGKSSKGLQNLASPKKTLL